MLQNYDAYLKSHGTAWENNVIYALDLLHNQINFDNCIFRNNITKLVITLSIEWLLMGNELQFKWCTQNNSKCFHTWKVYVEKNNIQRKKRRKICILMNDEITSFLNMGLVLPQILLQIKIYLFIVYRTVIKAFWIFTYSNMCVSVYLSFWI